MQNMILATPVLSDAATLMGSPASGGLTLENLKTMSLKEVYRAASASSVTIIIDLLAAKAINLVSLIGHSGSSRSSARIRAANTLSSLTSTPGYDTGAVPFRSHQSGYDATWAAGVADEQAGSLPVNTFMRFFAVQTFRYWQIDIADPLGTYLDIGRLYVAKAWQPPINMAYGYGDGWIDPSRKARTVSGQVVPVQRVPYRFSEFTLAFGTKADMYANIFEIERLRGRTRDVLFTPDPDETTDLQRRTLYGTLENLQPLINSNYGLFEKTLRIEEIPA